MTNFMRRASANPLLIWPLVSSVLFFTVSCQKTESLVPQTLTGKEIFRGIFFFEGKLPSMISYLGESAEMLNEIQEENKMSGESRNRLKQFQTDLLNYLDKKDANFFNKFRRAMTSGDPYLIRESVEAANKEVGIYIKNLQNSTSQINKEAINKVFQSSDWKTFASKGNITKAEKKAFVLKALSQVEKEKVKLSNTKTSIQSITDPTTNCLAFEIVFVGAYFFILVAVFAWVSLIVAVDGLALATMIYEDFQFIDPTAPEPRVGYNKTKQDIAISQIAEKLVLFR